MRSFYQKLLYRALLFFSIFFFHPVISSAQSNSSGWIDYNHTQFLSSKLAVVGDIGFRTEFSNNESNVTYIRPGMRYQINTTFRVQANVAAFQTFNQNLPNSTELRLAQEVNASWPRFVGFRVGHRFRVEERFFYYQGFEQAESGPGRDQSIRLRYFLDGTTESTSIGPLRNIYLTASFEFFANAGEETQEYKSDQSRIYGGWGQTYKGWGYVIHFIWLRSRNSFGNFESDEFVVRLRINFSSKIHERAAAK